MDSFQVGDARVHRVEEWAGNFLPPSELFVGYTEAEFAPHAGEFAPNYYDAAEGRLYALLQSWIIEHEGRTILFDTGAGNDKIRPGIPIFEKLSIPFLERMAARGFTPEKIDTVVCSHLHIDHVGWNTRLEGDAWVPTFPGAKYLFPRIDTEFWDPANEARFPDKVGGTVNQGVFEDSVAPVLEAGLAELVDEGHEVAPGLRMEYAPGHTPGQMVMWLESRGERAVFVGDMLHHPMQVYCPDWNSCFCEDGVQARATRRRVLGRIAEEEALMVPAHFGGEHVVRVRKEGGAFAPIAADLGQ